MKAFDSCCCGRFPDLVALCLALASPGLLGGQHPQVLPPSIESGPQGKFHVQGIGVDPARGEVYWSFTDKLVKTDLSGKLIGSVTGFVGHLGDLHFDARSGKIYGSLEYKDDVIGKGITRGLGLEDRESVGFYIAIFDGANITRSGMDAAQAGMRSVYLREVVDDYMAEVREGGQVRKHRHACSGIDGITLGPDLGAARDSQRFLYVAYGIYGDVERTDNDDQVILQYDLAGWEEWAKPHSQDELHHSGPEKPRFKYFVPTGNTHWGIQNLDWDPASGNFYAAVYPGKKKGLPNYHLFVIDGAKQPVPGTVSSDGRVLNVLKLSLVDGGLRDEATGIRGWRFPYGSTGLQALGGGCFYISQPRTTAAGQESSLRKYQWLGEPKKAFVEVGQAGESSP